MARWPLPRQEVSGTPYSLEWKGSTKKKPKGSLGPRWAHREACLGLGQRSWGNSVYPEQRVMSEACGSCLPAFAWSSGCSLELLTRQGSSMLARHLGTGTRMLGDKAPDLWSPGREGQGQTVLWRHLQASRPGAEPWVLFAWSVLWLCPGLAGVQP